MVSVTLSINFGSLILLSALLIFLQHENACGQEIQEWPHYRNLDGNGTYIVQWGHNSTDIEFVVVVKTRGFFEFGISRDGTMFPADMVLGWIAKEHIYFGDYHTVTDVTPVMDQVSNWHVISAYETNDTTVFRFTRKLDTCDDQDEKITGDTMIILYGLNVNDPNATTGDIIGTTDRGSAFMMLLEKDAEPTSMPDGTFQLPIASNQFLIPPHFTRLCIPLNMTGQIGNSHLIRYEPIITPGNEPYVYRMILYQCNTPVADDINGGQFECESTKVSSYKSCKSTVAIWAQGGQAFTLPDNVGLPIGGSADPYTLVLEIHYTNFELREGLQDSSGIKLTFTTQPRQYEAGLMELGTMITQKWKAFIPGQESNFRSKSYCSPRCMKWGFEGRSLPINAIGLHFQGNYAATSMKLRHFRGQNELPWISEDKAFSSFFQTTRTLNTPVQVLQDDTLSLECTYSTSRRQNVTRGGWSAIDEMCRATLLYYPRKPLDMCLSWSSFDTLFNTSSGQTVQQGKAIEYLSGINVWDAAIKKNLKDALKTSTERVLCFSQQRSQNRTAIDTFIQPKLQNIYVPQRSGCQAVPAQASPVFIETTGTGSGQNGKGRLLPPSQTNF